MMKIIWKNIALEWLFYWFLKFTLALIAAMLVLGLTGVNLLTKVYPYVKTTLSMNEITTYAKAYLASTNKQFLEFRVPTEQFVRDDMINSVSYVVPTSLADNAIALHAFIYGPQQTTSTDETASGTDNTSTNSTNKYKQFKQQYLYPLCTNSRAS